ncbi:MAG: prepilin peptidase [Planctomycetes bacterium]|nr:prepilin peptidase [Planctomycetota bacterium]
MIPAALPAWLVAAFVLALGLCVGSFLNVAIWRLPRRCLRLWRPLYSSCPSCRAAIAWYDNIPVLSWLLLGARCRRCEGRIALRYPAVELLTAALFLHAAGTCAGPRGWPVAAVGMVFGAALLAATWIDGEWRIIPDEITLRGMVLAPVVSWLVPGLHLVSGSALHEPPDLRPLAARLALPWPAGDGGAARSVLIAALAVAGGTAALFLARSWFRGPGREPGWALADGLYHALGAAAALGGLAALGAFPGLAADPRARSAAASLVGICFGSGLLWAIGVLGTAAFRKEAMGFGDVKFLGLIGGVLGWKAVGAVLFLACVGGAVVGVLIKLVRRTSYIPFGPFLAASAAAVYFHGEAIARWFLDVYLPWSAALLD